MEQDLFCICPYTTAQRLIQGKWAILIMRHLNGGKLRFNELQRRMPKMTHATLSVQLKQLEAEGLVLRTEYAQVPPKVEYELSDIGRKFEPVLASIQVWGTQYAEYRKKTNKQ